MKNAAVNIPVIGILLIAILFVIFMLIPTWQQNKYQDLRAIHWQLNEELVNTERELQNANVRINALTSLPHLDSLATAMGLGYNTIPIKIKDHRIQEVNNAE